MNEKRPESLGEVAKELIESVDRFEKFLDESTVFKKFRSVRSKIVTDEEKIKNVLPFLTENERIALRNKAYEYSKTVVQKASEMVDFLIDVVNMYGYENIINKTFEELNAMIYCETVGWGL